MANNDLIIINQILEREMISLDTGLDMDKFFEFFSITHFLKEYELSYEEVQAGICGKSHDGGADALFLFVNGDLIKEDVKSKDYKKNVDIEIYIIQAKNQNSFGEDAFLKWSRLSRNFFDLEFDGEDFVGRYTDKVISFFEMFRSTYLSLATKKPKIKINYIYISKGDDVHINVKRQSIDLVNDVVNLLREAEVDVQFIGAISLIEIINKRVNEDYKLRVSENPMSCGDQKVFIVLAKLSDYYKMITNSDNKLIKHIFESNVRDYQGKTSVNNEIQETLEKHESDEFWWLNNGITILAADASAPGGREIILYNPEIVNGLQTSNEIYRYFFKFPDKLLTDTRNVLIRIVVTDIPDIRDRIIKATNSQTHIPKASLRATDYIHRQIEDYFKVKGLYYDRRKNHYKNLGKKPKEIISVPFLSQCLISILMQKPDYARARPSTLLDDDATYKKLFHKNTDLSTYYFIAYLGKSVDGILKSKTNFTSSEVNNIMFYIIYALAVKYTRNIYPSNFSLKDLKIDIINELDVNYISNIVFDVFHKHGATDKIAKGSEMKETLKKVLRTEFSLA